MQGLARAVEAEVERQLESLPRAKIAGASWRDNGAIILCPSLEAALPLVDRLAPEHLEIMADDAEALGDKISNAGAIFLGSYTPEAIGDYVGGSNHVLPTARSARFSSGLGVLDFMKRTSLLKCDARSLEALGPAAIALGRSRGARRRTRARSRSGFARIAHERQTDQEPQSPRRGDSGRSDHPARRAPMSIMSGRWRSST